MENQQRKEREIGQVSVDFSNLLPDTRKGYSKVDEFRLFTVVYDTIPAGGKIDWNNERFKQAGNQFQFVIKSVTIQCYDNHPANHAYKYIRNKETNNELAFKAVKLEGYGVSKKATPALQLQQALSAQNLDETYKQQQPRGVEVVSQDGPLRLPSNGGIRR